MTKKGVTFWDVIEDALSQTYSSTGRRYYVYANKGKVYLVQRKETKTMPLLALGSNIISYERTRSIEDTRTRLKLVSSNGKDKGTVQVKSLEKKIGVWREVEQVDKKISKTEKNKRINTFKREKAVIGQTMKVDALGVTSVRSGGCVYVKVDPLKVERVFYVEEDTHTWEKGQYTMSLKLDFMK